MDYQLSTSSQSLSHSKKNIPNTAKTPQNITPDSVSTHFKISDDLRGTLQVIQEIAEENRRNGNEAKMDKALEEARKKLQSIEQPASLRAKQDVIAKKRPNEKNERGKSLREACNKLRNNPSKFRFIKDSYGDLAIQFPELGMTQRYEHLRVGDMKVGAYSDGAEVNDYTLGGAFSGMDNKEQLPLIFKSTIDGQTPAWKKSMNEDCYARGYTRKTKTHVDKMLSYLAKELGLSYNPNATEDQSVVKAYMFLTGSIGCEWLNTEYKNNTYGRDGDKYGQINNESFSSRAVVLCNGGYQSMDRYSSASTSRSIPLLKVDG